MFSIVFSLKPKPMANLDFNLFADIPICQQLG